MRRDLLQPSADAPVPHDFRRCHGPVVRKWGRARYKAERDVIAARYAEWELCGPPAIGGRREPRLLT